MEQDKVIRQLFGERIALMAYINMIVHDRHYAEDLFQDLSIEAIEKSDTINDAEHLTRWLRTGARYRAIDHLRRQDKLSIALAPDLLDKMDLVWESASSNAIPMRVEALRICLSSMPGHTQKLVRMRYEAGKSGNEIAKDVGRTSNAVYLALSRAHRALRDCIEHRLKTTASVSDGGAR